MKQSNSDIYYNFSIASKGYQVNQTSFEKSLFCHLYFVNRKIEQYGQETL